MAPHMRIDFHRRYKEETRSCGFWVVALFVTIPYYLVYPAEAQQLRDAMQERRDIIEGEVS
jgi:hypothetical protein